MANLKRVLDLLTALRLLLRLYKIFFLKMEATDSAEACVAGCGVSYGGVANLSLANGIGFMAVSLAYVRWNICSKGDRIEPCLWRC